MSAGRDTDRMDDDTGFHLIDWCFCQSVMPCQYSINQRAEPVPVPVKVHSPGPLFTPYAPS